MDIKLKEQMVDFVRAMTGTSDAAGGYLVPDEFRAEVIRKVEYIAKFRSRVRIFPMKSDVCNFPTATNGFVAYWGMGNDLNAITQSAATFNRKPFVAQNLGAAGTLDKDLLADAGVDVVDLVTDMIAETISLAEDTGIINGLGSGSLTMLGVLQDSGVATVTSNSTGVIAADDVIDLEYGLASQYRAGAVYVLANSAIKAIRKLKDDYGQYLWQQNYQAGTPPTLNGYPVIESPDMPAVAAGNKAIIFGNFKRYYMGDRQTMRIETSDSAGADIFLKDQILMKVKERVDGRVADTNGFVTLTIKAS